MKRKFSFYKEHFGRANEELRLHPPAKKVLKTIYNQGIKAKSFLDVGCGDGTITIKLKHALQTEETYGVDISDEALRSAVQKGIKVAKVDLDEERLPFPDESFDLVYCGVLIEHLTDPDHLLDEVYRVLKHSSLFIVTTPNLAGWVNRLLLLFGWQPYGTEVSYRYDVGKPYLIRGKEMAGHLRVFTMKALKEALTIHKFSSIKLYGANIEWIPSKYFRFIQVFDRLLTLRPSLSMHCIALATKSSS